MNNKLCLVVCFIYLTALSVSGQNDTIIFGKIGQEEYLMKQYDFDKDAGAVVLYDKALSRFVGAEKSFDIIYERETRIKVLSEAGLKWAEIAIPFYQENEVYENIFKLEAYSYNYADGQVIKTPLDISNVFDEKINEQWSLKKFAIPNVKVGSIIEYRYKINSPYVFNLRDWQIQWHIPVVYSEYEIRMIPFYEYIFILQGAKKFYEQKSHLDEFTKKFGLIEYKENIHNLVMKDIPAFKSESFITSINIMKVDFQLAKINYQSGGSKEIITTWEKLNQDLLSDSKFGGYIKRSKRIAQKLIKDDIKKLKTEKEKFNYILDYVKKNYSWDKRNDKYTTKSPKDFVKEKHGNCSEINLFTVGLLNAAGINAKPVLMSTRKNGKIKENYPLISYFNYVIILAKVEGNNILTDATEILNLNTRVPPKCINDRGLIVDKGKALWIDLKCRFISEEICGFYIEIDSNKIMNTNIIKRAKEYAGLHYRNEYGNDSKKILKMLENKNHTIIDSTIQVKNFLKKEKPYILEYSQTSSPEIVNNKIYISPFLDESISVNPLKEDERTYPIDITYPRKNIYSSTIIIPKGYKIDYLPKTKNIKNDLFELAYNHSIEGDKILVTFIYTFTKSIYPPKDYSKIKSYFNDIVRMGQEKIVFSKK